VSPLEREHQVTRSLARVLLSILLAGAGLAQGKTPPDQAAAPAAQDQTTRAKIAQYLRERFSIANSSTVIVAPLRPSIYPDFDLTTVTVQTGAQKESSRFYVSKDGNYLVEGNIFGLNDNPQTEIEHLINTQGAASSGPADAPVTIVEYADLECPHCAEEQQFIDNQLLPKYGGKIRIVYKDYPLYTIHPWAVAAALAEECAYRVNSADFLPFRELVFQNQNAIQPATARQQLLGFGAKAGLDAAKFGACLNSKATLPTVEQDVREGNRLGVASTPTFFINGKMVSGVPPPQVFLDLVNQALANAQSAKSISK
jgi:protein-disulfide isomerase